MRINRLVHAGSVQSGHVLIAEDAMDTGYWIHDGRIYTAIAYSGFRIENKLIYGPIGDTGFWIEDDVVFGPEGKTEYFTDGRKIFGPDESVPWSSTSTV
ncbi:MAG: hypothetical protein IID42_07835 [Planctomycetes bacterium]|nr:hypothetical protein [Planctomycetota bacterium]